MTQIFLSHSTRDAEFAARLAADLRRVNVPVWKAPESIQKGEEWVTAIQRGLSTSTHFLLLMSPAAVESEWVNFEFNIALRRSMRKQMVIVPLDYQPCDPPDFWTQFQIIEDISTNYADKLLEVLAELNRQTPAHPPNPADPRATINITIHGDASNITVAGHDVIYKGQPIAPPVIDPPDSRMEAAPPAIRNPVGTRYSASAVPASHKAPIQKNMWLVIGLLAVVVVIGIWVAASGVFGGGGDRAKATETLTVEPTTTTTPILTAGEAARARAQAGVTANADWTPYMEEFNGVAMALVPAGCFQMGSTDGAEDEKPVHKVCFDAPYWIDVTEVTNKQYGSSGKWSGDDLPRENVTWEQAKAHCDSPGERLPTEAEWEYSARGPNGLAYVWGDSLVEGNAVYKDNSGGQTAPVGSKPGGVSWVGGLDMSGNVWEWLNDWYGETAYSALSDGVINPGGPGRGVLRDARGGSWNSEADYLYATYRYGFDPSTRIDTIGFRCARSY